jgi:hypothetical protein
MKVELTAQNLFGHLIQINQDCNSFQRTPKKDATPKNMVLSEKKVRLREQVMSSPENALPK